MLGGVGQPRVCRVPGKIKEFHDGAGLASPGRWDVERRRWCEESWITELRKDILNIVVEACGGLSKLDKACFEMAVKGEMGCSLVKDENVRGRLLDAMTAALEKQGWDITDIKRISDYILWPIRTEDHSFWCLDAWKGDWVQLDKCGFIAPVGIERFFDAFCFDPQRPWRTAASQALGIPSCHIAEDTHIKQSEGNKFTLTPRRIPAERRTVAEKSGADVVMDAGEESGSGDESGWSGVSDNSCTDSECTILEASSVASDQDRFDAAYEAFRDLSEGLYDIATRQCARGVTSDGAPGVKLSDGQAKLREWYTCLAIGHWLG